MYLKLEPHNEVIF